MAILNPKPIKWHRDGECIICTSHCLTGSGGYPAIVRNKKMIRIGRLICNRRYGDEAGVGKVTMHSCDNPRCINPNHLSFGTNKQNSEDMSRKRRAEHGSDRHCAKLDNQKALEIFFSSKGARFLSEQYGVSRTVIYGIRNKTKWNHIHDPL